MADSDPRNNRDITRFFPEMHQVAYAGELYEGDADFDISGLVPSAYLAAPGGRRAAEHGAEAPAHLLDNYRDPQPLNGRTIEHYTGNEQDFFSYDGSLTTPGCGEIVYWNVINPLVCVWVILGAEVSLRRRVSSGNLRIRQWGQARTHARRAATRSHRTVPPLTYVQAEANKMTITTAQLEKLYALWATPAPETGMLRA